MVVGEHYHFLGVMDSRRHLLFRGAFEAHLVVGVAAPDLNEVQADLLGTDGHGVLQQPLAEGLGRGHAD